MGKKQITFLVPVILFLLIINLPLVFADTIILKSGRRIEGKISEKTDKYIKVDTDDLNLTFWLDEIEKVETTEPSLPVSSVSKPIAGTSEEVERLISKANDDFLEEKFEDAVLLIEKAIELDPTNPRLYFGLGMADCYLGRFQEAISSLEEALKKETKDTAKVYLLLGIAYDSIGLKDKAKENLNRAIGQYKKEENILDMVFVKVLLKKISKE